MSFFTSSSSQSSSSTSFKNANGNVDEAEDSSSAPSQTNKSQHQQSQRPKETELQVLTLDSNSGGAMMNETSRGNSNDGPEGDSAGCNAATIENFERMLMDSHDKLLKLEVALKNYNLEMEKVDSFHHECLNIWSSLSVETNKLQVALQSAKRNTNFSENLTKSLDWIISSTELISNRLKTIKYHIPQPTGAYLKAIIGPISLSLPTAKAKFLYKNSYENLKLIHSIFTLCFSTLLIFINNKYFDTIYSLHLLWYYCTLTVREKILKMNGSNIRKWWFMHHILSVINSCILLTWSFDSYSYKLFRPYMMLFSAYLAGVSFVQVYYQKGCLYRYYALGFTENKMDVTVDGFVSWMWKNLSFLLPLLIIAYLGELLLVKKLIEINGHISCKEWQPAAICAFLGLMSIGNIITVCILIKRKVSTYHDMKSFSFGKYYGIDQLLATSQLSKFYTSFKQYNSLPGNSLSSSTLLSRAAAIASSRQGIRGGSSHTRDNSGGSDVASTAMQNGN